MKRFFMALTIFLAISAQVEAVPFSREQVDRIFIDIEAAENISTLNFNVATLKNNFNAIMTPILQQTMGTDDISAMEHLFLINDKDSKTFSKPNGDIFANIFGDYRVALVGATNSNGNFKILSLYYTSPEEKDESLFTVWLLTAFVKSISPDVDPQTLMNELTAENSSSSTVKGNVKFSIASEGNLNVLTATAQ